MAGRRNILFIVADQMRADLLTGALADHVRLPNLNALMEDAVTFGNHFSVTCPCGPSRASLYTGLYPMNHRSVRNGVPLDGRFTNVAKEVRKAGYDPMLFGYTDTSQDPRRFHPSDPDIRSYERVLPGFREIVEMREEFSYPWRAHLKSRGYDLPDYACFYHPVAGESGRPPALGDPAFYSAEDSDTAFLTDRLLDELTVRSGTNWFAHQSYIRPHPPFIAPRPYNDMYDPAQLPAPLRKPDREAEAAVHPFFDALLRKTRISKYVEGLDGRIDDHSDDHIQILRSIYLGLVTEVDAHVGRIIRFLKKTGQYDSTLLVFTSDHGEMLGDRHMWGKDTVYDAAYHVPLIIRDPDHLESFGTRVDRFTESVDVTPTILDWAGLTVPSAMDGHSLCPFLRGESSTSWRDYVHFELDLADPESPTVWQQQTGLSMRDANATVIREKKYKLAHFNGGFPPLLFDLESEAGEMLDLASDPDHAATVLRLTQRLLDHRLRHADHTLSDMKVTAGGTINYVAD